MGKLTVSGLDELMNDFAALASLPDSVTDAILNAEADVVVSAQQKEAASRWRGPYATGTTAKSIKKGKPQKAKDGKQIIVSPKGNNRRGTRNAEVAFINEYGKRGQPARPAIRTANAQAEQQAVDAGEKAYNSYLNSKKL